MILALRITNSKYSLMLSSGYFILFPKIISHILNLVSQGLDKKKKNYYIMVYFLCTFTLCTVYVYS